jgi:hypothetical protein
MTLAITQNEYHDLPPSVSPFVRKLINQLLKKKPQERPDASTILRMKEI